MRRLHVGPEEGQDRGHFRDAGIHARHVRNPDVPKLVLSGHVHAGRADARRDDQRRSATDIGWQYMEANHGSQYCAVAGGPTRDTVKYGLGPDVLLKQNGTLVMPTDPDSSLYWLLYDDFLPWISPRWG